MWKMVYMKDGKKMEFQSMQSTYAKYCQAHTYTHIKKNNKTTAQKPYSGASSRH